MSEVGTSPPHDLFTPHILVAGNTHTHMRIVVLPFAFDSIKTMNTSALYCVHFIIFNLSLQ